MTQPDLSSLALPQHFRVNDEDIEMWALLRALCRISDRQFSIEQTGYEEEEWKAFAARGSINDREWETIATAPTLIRLLTELGKK